MVNPEHPDLGPDTPSGPVPVENQPGHHPEAEQDKPNLDKFAAKLGIVDEPEGDDAAQPRPQAAPAGRKVPTFAVAGAVAALLAAVAAVVVRRRRRR